MLKYKDKVGYLYEKISLDKAFNRVVLVYFVFKRVLFVLGAFYFKV